MPRTPAVLVLTAVLTLLIAGDALFAWTAPAAIPPASNIAAPVHTGGAAQSKTGLLGVGELIASSRLMVGRSTAPTGALVATNGNVAAAAYCDQNGENCFTPDAVGAGATTQTCTYETQQVSGCISTPSCPAGWTQLGAATRQPAACGVNGNQDRYTITCGRNVCTTNTTSSGIAYGGFYVQRGSCTSGTTVSCSMTNPTCSVTNPVTGGCTCPTGFTARSEGAVSRVSCSRNEDSDPLCGPAAPQQTTQCYRL